MAKDCMLAGFKNNKEPEIVYFLILSHICLFLSFMSTFHESIDKC